MPIEHIHNFCNIGHFNTPSRQVDVLQSSCTDPQFMQSSPGNLIYPVDL